MPTRTLTLPRPHSGQIAVRQAAKRFNVLACGRRWGKSTYEIERLIGPALAGYPVGWFAPAYKYLAEVWRTFARLLRPVTRRSNASEHRIELVTGGVLEMWTLDDPDAGRSRRYKRIAVDEAAKVPDLLERWHLALRPTLADFAGDADFVSTPKGYNDFYTLWGWGQEAERTEWASFQRPTADNPWIPASEIAAMQADMTSLQFSQEVLALFVNLTGGLFRREWFNEHYLDARPGDVAAWVRFWDLAVSIKATADYTAGGLLGQRLGGALCLADVVRGRWEWPAAKEIIVETARADGPKVTIGVETVAFQLAAVQELQRDKRLLGHTVQASTPDRDKYARAMPVASRAERGLLELVRGPWTSPFLAELSEFPDGEHDDQVDMVSGGLQTLADGNSGWLAQARALKAAADARQQAVPA